VSSCGRGGIEIWSFDFDLGKERKKGKSSGWACGYINFGMRMRLARLKGPGFDWRCLRFYPQ
jgi:hypothetical protein